VKAFRLPRAAEAAAAQGKFWEMHHRLLEHQDALTAADLLQHAAEAGLDTGRFKTHMRERAGAAKVAADVDSADLSNVSGTPTFFINGRRHHGTYDIDSLTEAVRSAKAQALITRSNSARTPARPTDSMMLLELARDDGRWALVHAFPATTNSPSNGICRSLGFRLAGERDATFAGRVLRSDHWVINPATDLT
jgi:predicted DsbA family dithiol-disulfide isomerase